MSKEFAQGVVYAAARLVELYDQPAMAASIIEESGLSDEDFEQCSDYDLEFLRGELPDLPTGI